MVVVVFFSIQKRKMIFTNKKFFFFLKALVRENFLESSSERKFSFKTHNPLKKSSSNFSEGGLLVCLSLPLKKEDKFYLKGMKS